MSRILRRHTPSQKKVKPIVILLIFFFLSTSALVFYFYPFASSKKNPYFKYDQQILYKGSLYGKAHLEKNAIYLPLSFIRDKISDQVYIDTEEQAVIFTTKSSVFYIPIESKEYEINNEKKADEQIIVKADNDEWMMNILFLKHYVPLDVRVVENSGAVWIEKSGETYVNGTIAGKNADQAFLRLREKPSLQSPYVAEVQHDEQVRIEGEKEDYYSIRTAEGYQGYMKKKFVTKQEENVITINMEEEPIKLPDLKEPINLTWEAVYTKNPSTDQLPAMPGVNVVSPTWFHLGNEKGDLKNLASSEYVEWAKNSGRQIWGLFSNSFDPELTKKAFQSYQSRKHIIDQLVHFAKHYQLEGINIDIENVDPDDAPLVTQFVREAAARLHQAGKIVSMDITFISTGNWSAFLEREKLAQTVDYLVVMAYDEHWGSSQTAGSVASLPWVEANLNTLLEEVPAETLILGLPLYTRLWIEETHEGEQKMSSKALSMQQAQEWMQERNLEASYDDASGQRYVEWQDDQTNTIYRIWLEDDVSLQKRVDLAKKYNLAGIGTWSRFFADDTAWHTLQQALTAQEE